MPEGVTLKRSLRLWHLIAYGIIIIQPTAPMGIYGVVYNIAHGHVVTTVLLAMVAMLFTAVSYGRMAAVYPQAGSAYAYVSRELHPKLGYVVGWSMLMDYVLNPIIRVIWCSGAARNILPGVPYVYWVFAFAGLATVLNTRGIQTSGRLNTVLVIVMSIVVVLFFGEGIRYVLQVLHPSAADLVRPFFDGPNFRPGDVLRGTSVAVLTYIGFDGISTMAEEVENPRRNIMLATVLTCVFIGLLSTAQVYLAQLAVPYRGPFPAATVDTAFVHVSLGIGGRPLFHLINATLLTANFGSAVAAQFGASRLMYSMGSGGSLPPHVFGALSARHRVPLNNVLIVGTVTLFGAFTLSYGQGAELLNFGAFIAFIGVNIAALRHALRTRGSGALLPAALPTIGAVVCIGIWLGLSRTARCLGFAWLALGLLIAWIMRGTIRNPA